MPTSVAPVLRCRACGPELPPAAKFCFECGQPVENAARAASKEVVERVLSATSTLEGERKHVTILFADLKGSLELIADRDPEDARRLLDPALEHMCDAVEKYGGTVSQVMGDGILALFGAPVSWEDHAIRACHAALSMLDLVRHYGEAVQRQCGMPIQIRIGLNSGEVPHHVSGHGLHVSYTAVGQPVHIAARMEQVASPGAIRATAETVRLAEGYIEARRIGPVRVKGFERPVEVAEIARLRAGQSRFERASVRALTPFIGREAELARLSAVFESAVAQRIGRIAIVVGEPGIGRSRLVHEFLRSVAHRALTLEGGGAPYSGAGSRPLSRLLRHYFDIDDADDKTAVQEKVAGRIVALNGDANTLVAPILALFRALPPDHRFFGLPANERRQLAFSALMWLGRRMASDRPPVLAYEDLHWASADARDFLAAFALQLPPSTLVVLTYRSDYDAGWLITAERSRGAGGAHRPARAERQARAAGPRGNRGGRQRRVPRARVRHCGGTVAPVAAPPGEGGAHRRAERRSEARLRIQALAYPDGRVGHDAAAAAPRAPPACDEGARGQRRLRRARPSRAVRRRLGVGASLPARSGPDRGLARRQRRGGRTLRACTHRPAAAARDAGNAGPRFRLALRRAQRDDALGPESAAPRGAPGGAPDRRAAGRRPAARAGHVVPQSLLRQRRQLAARVRDQRAGIGTRQARGRDPRADRRPPEPRRDPPGSRRLSAGL